MINTKKKMKRFGYRTRIDGVPAWLLKRFHEELAPVVHDIICASIV